MQQTRPLPPSLSRPISPLRHSPSRERLSLADFAALPGESPIQRAQRIARDLGAGDKAIVARIGPQVAEPACDATGSIPGAELATPVLPLVITGPGGDFTTAIHGGRTDAIPGTADQHDAIRNEIATELAREDMPSAAEVREEVVGLRLCPEPRAGRDRHNLRDFEYCGNNDFGVRMYRKRCTRCDFISEPVSEVVAFPPSHGHGPDGDN